MFYLAKNDPVPCGTHRQVVQQRRKKTGTLLRIDSSSKSISTKSLHIAFHDVPCDAESNSQGVLIEGRAVSLLLDERHASAKRRLTNAAQFTA